MHCSRRNFTLRIQGYICNTIVLFSQTFYHLTLDLLEVISKSCLEFVDLEIYLPLIVIDELEHLLQKKVRKQKTEGSPIWFYHDHVLYSIPPPCNTISNFKCIFLNTHTPGCVKVPREHKRELLQPVVTASKLSPLCSIQVDSPPLQCYWSQ